MFIIVALPVALAQESPAPNPGLATLGDEIHAWLAVNRSVSPNAFDRIPRPPGWQPDWSQTSLQQRKIEFLKLQARLKAVDALGFDTADRIDAAMLGATVAGVHWRLEVLASARRDPGFYIDQSLGSVFSLLAGSPEPSTEEIGEIITRLQGFTGLVNAAKLNLDRVVPELAEAAISRIGEVNARVDGLESALLPRVPESAQAALALGLRAARQSLASYKDWLSVSLPRFREPPDIGVQRYRWYLGHVAMVPRSPDAILAEAELMLARVGARLAVSRHRSQVGSDTGSLESARRVAQMSRITASELSAFIESTGLVDLPENTPGFQLEAFPATLAPLEGVGESVTFAARDAGDGRRYLHERRDAAGYPEALAWQDPRLLLSWDGAPGRQAQFHMASGHDRPIRRHATDSTLSAGIATYFQQQIMEAGLYAFSPASAQNALEFLGHQAALAIADIRLAKGALGVEGAVDFLVEATALSRRLAAREVQAMMARPGHAGAAFAAYGQVIRFLADASRMRGEKFSLSEFNARLLRNANVPIALQRWEYLGLEDELDALVEQRGRPATVPE